MKERPILFSGPMVRAILDGRKTQTRRVLSIDHCQLAIGTHFNRDAESIGEWKLNPKCDTPEGHRHHGYLRAFPGVRVASARCPYGVPGDRLWVREGLKWGDETWQYAADGSDVMYSVATETAAKVWSFHKEGTTCPSIHMPRWASRLTLEVVSVRVERLNEISIDDAMAEGCPDDCGGHADCGDWFESLWDSINAAKHPWSSNPWVWVVEFKKLDGAGGAA